MRPLTMAAMGEAHAVCKITGNDEVRRHLTDLGFVTGAVVSVVAELGGGLILAVRDGRIALDKGMANRIMI